MIYISRNIFKSKENVEGDIQEGNEITVAPKADTALPVLATTMPAWQNKSWSNSNRVQATKRVELSSYLIEELRHLACIFLHDSILARKFYLISFPQ